MTIKKKKKTDPPDRSKTDISLDDIRDMLYQALEQKGNDIYLNQVYGSYMIYEQDGKYFRLPYSILEGEVQLGSEPVEVERVWVEAKAQQAELDDGLNMLMRLGQAQNQEGTAWDVTVCAPGFTKNGWYLPEDVLRQSAGLFNNTDVNIYEIPDKGATHVDHSLFDVKSLLVKNKAGWLEGARYVAGEGIKATLHFLDSFQWMGRNLLDAMNKGATVYGLSWDAGVKATKETISNRLVMKLLEFLAVDSVDIVTRPAAGGAFNRAIASMAHKQREDIMDREQLLTLIGEKRPDLLKGKDLEKVTDEQVVEFARMAMEPTVTPPGGDNGTGGGNDDPPESDNTHVTRDELARFRCEMDLDKALDKSDLPDAAQDRIRAVFSETVEGAERVRIFTGEQLEKAIADEKDYLAKMTSKPEGDGVPASHIVMGLGTLERAQMAVDRMFGLTKEDVEAMARMETLENQPFFMERTGAAEFHVRSAQDVADYDQVPSFRDIREMYSFFTGDKEVTGFFNRKNLPPDLRSRMDITSSTFTYVLGNTMGRRLVKAYREADYLERLLISVKKKVKDFRTQEAVLVGGFPDLADVDPEAADYAEISAVTDEESTYSLGQKGNLLTISRKTIINDDLTIVMRLVNAIGRAARRTHGQYVWDMYIDNDNCTDGTAVFTGGHANLGATALSHTTALVAWKALAGMTEKDSSKYLGLLDGADVVVNLVGPTAIKELIGRIEKEEFYYSSNDLTNKLPNSLYGQIKGHTLSLLNADANDWFMILPAEIVELIEMGYLNGREEPEMFVADSPQSEQIFVADKIRHKIRHEYAGTPVDYRGAYKAVVT